MERQKVQAQPASFKVKIWAGLVLAAIIAGIAILFRSGIL